MWLLSFSLISRVPKLLIEADLTETTLAVTVLLTARNTALHSQLNYFVSL